MMAEKEVPGDLHEFSARREQLALECRMTEALFYQGQPDFDVPVACIHQYIDAM